MEQIQSIPAPGNPYLPILLLLIAAAGFALAPLALAWVWARNFSPRKPGPDKTPPTSAGWNRRATRGSNSGPSTNLYAIIFLIFDVETIFLLPFATAFTGLSAGAFVAMLVFILLLVEGLVWAWQKGVLTWK